MDWSRPTVAAWERPWPKAQAQGEFSALGGDRDLAHDGHIPVFGAGRIPSPFGNCRAGPASRHLAPT